MLGVGTARWDSVPSVDRCGCYWGNLGYLDGFSLVRVGRVVIVREVHKEVR